MALPTSGPLSLSDIQTEFGGSNPISLSEYYAGGAYVPSGTSGTYGAVPTSGAISLRNFYGTSKFTPVTRTYDGTSGTETIPTGATQVVIEVWGGGGGGSGSDTVTPAVGSGGGSGGYVRKTFTLVSGDAGKTFSYAAGATAAGGALDTVGSAGNNSTCSNGTFGTSFSLSGSGGGGGDPITGQGLGGLASGGDVNTAGNGGGGLIRTGAGAPNGGGDVSNGNGSTPGGGGAGGSLAGSVGGNGAAGRVRFAYT